MIGTGILLLGEALTMGLGLRARELKARDMGVVQAKRSAVLSFV